MPLSKAGEIIDRIRAKAPEILRLNPVNIFEVKVLKRLYALKYNTDLSQMRVTGITIEGAIKKLEWKKSINKVISQTLILFRQWRIYTFSGREDAKFAHVLAKAKFLKLQRKFKELSVIVQQSPYAKKYKKQINLLFADMGVLYHLAHDQAFLDASLPPLLAEGIMPACMHTDTFAFYQDALLVSQRSFAIFEDYMNNDFFPYLASIYSMCERQSALQTLVPLIDQYKRKVSESVEPFLRKLLPFTREIERDNDATLMRAIIQRLVPLDASYNGYLVHLFERTEPFYEKWQASAELLNSSEKAFANFNRYLEMSEHLILKNLEKSTLNKKAANELQNTIHELASKRQKIPDMKNACCVDTFRIPSLLVQSLHGNEQFLRILLDEEYRLIQLLSQQYKNTQFVGITVKDLFINWSLSILNAIPTEPLAKEAKDTLKKIASHISSIEYYDSQEFYDPEGLDQQTTKLIESIRKFCNLMTNVCQRETIPEARNPELFLELLRTMDSFLPSDQDPPNQKKMHTSIVFASLYRPFDNKTVLASEEIAFFKSQLSFQVDMYIDLIQSGCLSDIAKALSSFVEHSEESSCSKDFWKLQKAAFDFCHQALASVASAAEILKEQIPKLKNKKALANKLKKWITHLDRDLTVETSIALSLHGKTLTELAHQTENSQERKLGNLIQNLGLHTAIAMLIRRPFDQLLAFENEHSSRTKASSKPRNAKPIPEEESEEGLDLDEGYEPNPFELYNPFYHLREYAIEQPTPTSAPAPANPLPTAQLTPYEENFATLLRIQRHKPIPIQSQESAFSRFQRQEKMEQNIRCHFYLLALLKEEENAPSQVLLRGSTDYMRLLERTEKLALVYFPIAENNQHLLLNPNTRHLYTSSHDGVLLAEILSQSSPLFEDATLSPYLQKQDRALKISYWFHATEPKLTGKEQALVDHCNKVWSSLTLSSEQQRDDQSIANFRAMQQFIYQSKRKACRATDAIPDTLPPLSVLLTSLKEALNSSLPEKLENNKHNSTLQDLKKSLSRIFHLAEELNTHQGAKTASPLLFSNRYAEVQISLLSTVMQACLISFPTTIETEDGSIHPLFCNHKGEHKERPLIHSHNVEHLWETLSPLLKNTESPDRIGRSLQLFLGDPRYPYPNQSAISQDLVTAFELTSLRHVLKRGIFNWQSVKLARKYFPDVKKPAHLGQLKEPLEEKIEEHLNLLERKTRFALKLALDILSSL